MFSNRLIYYICEYLSVHLVKRYIPTNQENWPNIFPYMALYWANVLAIVPTHAGPVIILSLKVLIQDKNFEEIIFLNYSRIYLWT